MLFDTGMELQKTDFRSTSQRADVSSKLTEVLELISRHSFHEDRYIFPPIAAYHSKLMEELEKDHLYGEALNEQLLKLLEDLKAADHPHKWQTLGLQICRAFNRYLAFHLQHMEKEEEKVNQLLWEKFSDQEIADMKGAIVGPDLSSHLLVEVDWILKSISESEADSWLQGIRGRVSETIFNAFVALANKNGFRVDDH